MNDTSILDNVEEILYSPGNWYRFPKWIHKIKPLQQEGKNLVKKPFKPATAYILASLLDQSSIQRSSKRQGWFEYSAKIGMENTGYPKQVQEDHIKILIECGLITKKRDNKVYGQRLIKINRYLLRSLIIEADEEITSVNSTQDPPFTSVNSTQDSEALNQRKTYTQTRTNKKTQTVADASATARHHSSSSQSNDKSHRQNLNGSLVEEDLSTILARRLSVLLIKKGLRNSSPNLSMWAREFTKLRKDPEHTEEEILEVMSWYEKNVGEEFVNEAECGLSFRKKFGKLKKKMLKDKSSSSNYGTSVNPIPTKVAYTLDDGSIHSKKNSNLDWNEVEKIKDRLGDSFVAAIEFHARNGNTKIYRSTKEFPREGPLKKKSSPR